MIKKILDNPIKAFYYFISKSNKDFLYKQYSKKSKVNNLYFILSFDCDTHEDAEYAISVHNRLSNMGVTPIYAVPGQMLEKNPDVYKKLSLLGADFINHGYYEHTYFDEKVGDYRSNFFYDELSYDKIEEDITLGDNTVTKIIGKKPLGYRAPHFGVFQNKEQLEFLYSVLRKLDYKYSSSTIPYFSFKNGAYYEVDKLIEFPVTGMLENPMAILDTWGYFKAPERNKNKDDYKKDIIDLISYYEKNNLNGIINIYADILHIHDSDEFFDAIEIISKKCLNTTYEKLLEER